jgi:N-acylneuraminate cytidylyltransferase
MIMESFSEALAVIPARGGSKGVLRKNVRLLAGEPLLAHTVEIALGAACVDRVVVSTDDLEIAEVAEMYGVKVVWRPAEISGDVASSESALLHTLEYLKQAEGYDPDLLVFLQCTAPLTLAEDIDGTVGALLDEDADSAVAVTPFHYFLWQRDATGDAVGINHDKNERLLRQEQEPQYLETGAVYAMRVEGFLKARHRFFGRTAMYVMPSERRWEIDAPVDLKVAEVLMRAQQRKEHAAVLAPVELLVLDFDGVLTDNRVWVDQEGREAVHCHRGDGWGIARVREAGVEVVVLSTETNPVVQARCRKLGIECVNGLDDKLSVLQEMADARSLDRDRIAYVGNDVNDLDAMRWVGIPIAVADAEDDVKRAAQLITERRGGEGAVREVCDLILINDSTEKKLNLPQSTQRTQRKDKKY